MRHNNEMNLSKSSDQSLPVVLVDGSSYLHRAYHALPPLTTSTGKPTGAIRGVVSMLNRLARDYPQSPIIVVLDAPGGTFRDQIYPEYKQNRERMDEELAQQIDPLKKIIVAMGLPLLCVTGVEADDVIGTLACQAEVRRQQVVISATDKDLAQLVDNWVTVVDTMNNPPTVFDDEAVFAKFGVKPKQLVDYLALRGDSSDNIPGVAGVGQKSAAALLQAFGDLDTIYQRLDEVAELAVRGAKSLVKRLADGRDSAYLSKRLAQINTEVPLPYGIGSLPQEERDTDILQDMFQQLEFRSELQRLESDAVAGEAAEAHYELVLDSSDFEKWLAKLEQAPEFALDTETTSLNIMEARVVGVSVAVAAGEAAYIPFGHSYVGVPQQLSEQQVLGSLKPLLEDPQRRKVGQNLKYDRNVLANHGITLRGIGHDTMLASYVLDAGNGRHDMDYLAQRWLNKEVIHYEDVAGKGKKKITFDQVALDQAGPYAAEDADVTWQLSRLFAPRLDKSPQLQKLYRELELPLLPILADMERTGIAIDCSLLAKQSIELEQQLSVLQEDIWSEVGQQFNISSPKQLAGILFEKMSLPVVHRTAKGDASTTEKVLQTLAAQHPFVERILDFRHLSKLKSTYVDALPQQVCQRTGRVHTSWHQATVLTGRLASSGPNLQNIPIRTAEGRKIRAAFVAPSGYSLVAADYAQIELKLMAHFSGDPNLIKAFNEGQDIHRATAAEVFGVNPKEVTDEERRRAKAINFGLIYGMSAYGLAEQLQIDQHSARRYMDIYFSKYSKVREYMDQTCELARQQGYVETLFGRRLHLPGIKGKGPMARGAERQAINAPLQGTAADIIKRAMIDVQNMLEGRGDEAKMLLQVHDELVLEVKDDCVEAISAELCRMMERADGGLLQVPLTVVASSGANWNQAH